MKEEKKGEELTTPEMKEYKTVILVGAYLSGTAREVCVEHLDELERLCDTYGLEVLDRVPCPYKKLDAANYLGKGKIAELVAKGEELDADLIIFDDEISPHQQRNLEKLFSRPVIDRTELILEVFAQRAMTREARLQVQLAKTKYQFPRLRRLWTHLSRQVAGGGGYTKGEGEKQIEIDRRLLRRRIDKLQKELEKVRAQRGIQRSARLRTGIPTFAIVGYTNAGKSTLLKALTDADVLVEDKLFATLDTKTRKFILPNAQEILLVDTVGFIRKIPHTLVAAFRSTLEEVCFTDILLHLVDVSSPHAQEQAEETHHILKELGALEQPVITVLNKVDQCTNKELIARFRIKYPKTVAISALTKEGFQELLLLMEQELSNLRQLVTLRIPQSHYQLVSELTQEGRVFDLEYEENDVLLKVEIPNNLVHKTIPFQFG